jgi:hypothetical protein
MALKSFYIHVRTPYNSPIKTSYAGYTVFPGIGPSPGKLIPNLAAPSVFKASSKPLGLVVAEFSRAMLRTFGRAQSL